MAVISVSITESSEQIVQGIPRKISISTNIPCSVFYTLDGSNPTLFSTIYTSAIEMPTNYPKIILSILATNGVDSSPIIKETYQSEVIDNARYPYFSTDQPIQLIAQDKYPFGTNPVYPNSNYTNNGGVTVDDANLQQIANGFSADGYPAAFTNKPYTLENYEVIYTTTDSNGQSGNGIGNLPAEIKVIPEVQPPIESNQFDDSFDPRSNVIFQDYSKNNPNDPPNINRQFFSLENSEKIRDGNNFFNSGLDSPTTTGSFINAHYNPSDNTITYYYYDNIACRWIISKTPYVKTGSWDCDLSGIVRGRAGPHVYEWRPFARRVLF